jgi:hypothetical protein
MATQSNKRLFYASQQVGLKPDGDTGTPNALYGVQSVSMSTNFNLEQVFELGQIAIYENIENLPDVEVSMTKVLDGRPLIYHRATQQATSPTLAGRSTQKAIFVMSLFSDSNDSATGTPLSEVRCSGMFVNSIGYNFPVDGDFTEDVTLVGNDKVWVKDPKYSAAPTTFSFNGVFTTNTDAPTGSGGVNRRQDMIFTYSAASPLDSNSMVADADCTILPPDVWGISNSGTNEKSNGLDYDCHLQSISVSVDLGREPINELGRRAPYHRTPNFPVEVSTEISAIATSGDMISATENGILTQSAAACTDVGNLTNRTIRIATCEGTRIYLGVKNKLSSVNYSGGDAGGGNVTVSYTFTNFNDFTVLHSGDPNTSGTTWWTNRNSYLRNL